MTKKNSEMIGQKYGKLLVLSENKDDKREGIYFWCKCDCGNKELVSANKYRLLNGTKKSCGCLLRERNVKFNKKTKAKINSYDLSGDYGIGWTLNADEKFYFDLEDYDKIKDYCWYIHENKYGYKALETTKNKKQIRFQWLVKGKNVDHINRNPLDNRKCNLRNVSIRENSINHNIRKDNRSGVTGVNYNKRTEKWVARISDKRNHRIILYSGDSFEDAVKARLKAEKEYYGEHSPLRSQL